MESTRKIIIAISGGGLAGAAAARALLRQPHLEVHIYESAPEFSERGQSIGLAINAQRALKSLVPDSGNLLSRAGAVPMNSTRIMIGSGPHAGTKVIDLAEENPGYMMHRAALLHELLEPIPRENMHANKKLVAIEQQPHGLTLKFEDGTSESADALIGADGIFGFVRSYVLGDNHPALKPVAAGWAGAMNMVPFAKARDTLGPESFKINRQYGWVGENGLMIHDLINNGEMVQCIGTSVDRNPSDDRRKSINREYLETVFAKWLDGPVAKGMIDLLIDQEHPAVYEQWEHQNAPTYVNGQVCIIGDAAHAMTPWQGSGAAAALEDAVVLGALFAHINSPDDVERVLNVYDAVRRPRTQRIAESSRLTGRILSGIDETVGLDPTIMHEALKNRWTFIHGFNLDAHIETAVQNLKNDAK
ncbi:hypothetical protein BDV96DRAFT_484648 [Lophiotrema nucula]|uniref:FAD-binding domain-containing protein n=1 Tax=Lophiotrema nucula TaxID=690887 RepID=A0A6A5ZQ71_9PLEO|nr:hypothetical protein BDV96DRAFT_484648 [Lophiotrema nucula]